MKNRKRFCYLVCRMETITISREHAKKVETSLDVMLNTISLVAQPADKIFNIIMGMESVCEVDGCNRDGVYLKSRVCVIMILRRHFNGFDYFDIYGGFLHELRPIKDSGK